MLRAHSSIALVADKTPLLPTVMAPGDRAVLASCQRGREQTLTHQLVVGRASRPHVFVAEGQKAPKPRAYNTLHVQATRNATGGGLVGLGKFFGIDCVESVDRVGVGVRLRYRFSNPPNPNFVGWDRRGHVALSAWIRAVGPTEEPAARFTAHRRYGVAPLHPTRLRSNGRLAVVGAKKRDVLRAEAKVAFATLPNRGGGAEFSGAQGGVWVGVFTGGLGSGRDNEVLPCSIA